MPVDLEVRAWFLAVAIEMLWSVWGLLAEPANVPDREP